MANFIFDIYSELSLGHVRWIYRSELGGQIGVRDLSLEGSAYTA